jgi:hypothetical protein
MYRHIEIWMPRYHRHRQQLSRTWWSITNQTRGFYIFFWSSVFFERLNTKIIFTKNEDPQRVHIKRVEYNGPTYSIGGTDTHNLLQLAFTARKSNVGNGAGYVICASNQIESILAIVGAGYGVEARFEAGLAATDEVPICVRVVLSEAAVRSRT